jgi:3-dehydroquinate synthetase
VAYGLRAAMRIGQARGQTPAAWANRVEALLDRLELGVEPLDLDLETILDLLETDKKHAGGFLRWVLATGDGHAVDADVPDELVHDVASGVLAGRREREASMSVTGVGKAAR